MRDLCSNENKEEGKLNKQLKSCPFCDGDAYFIYNESSSKEDSYDIGCHTEDCICFEGLDWCLEKEKISKMWNTRKGGKEIEWE